MGSIIEEEHEGTEESAIQKQYHGAPSTNLHALISHGAVKRAVAQKKEQIMDYVMSDPQKYLIKDEDTSISIARMTNQREQGLVVRKVKESMDMVYERGFNVLEFDHVAQELEETIKEKGSNKKR